MHTGMFKLACSFSGTLPADSLPFCDFLSEQWHQAIEEGNHEAGVYRDELTDTILADLDRIRHVDMAHCAFFVQKTAQEKRLLRRITEEAPVPKAISQRYSKNVNLKICLGLPLGTFSIPAISTRSLSVHSWSSRCALRTVMSSR
jgi:cell division septum initiation protein DivIVA